ncbi:MAG: hypothetical protein VX016_03190 [Verrucomicrobiota bacterium]|nr:hypothetical protein [Verrucomicrobiota bacterium]
MSTEPFPPTPMWALCRRPLGELARRPDGRIENPARAVPEPRNFLREVLWSFIA